MFHAPKIYSFFSQEPFDAIVQRDPLNIWAALKRSPEVTLAQSNLKISYIFCYSGFLKTNYYE